MPKTYAQTGGANVALKKLFASTPDGVNHKLKSLWASSGVVNRKIFSGYDGTIQLSSNHNNGLSSVDIANGTIEIYTSSMDFKSVDVFFNIILDKTISLRKSTPFDLLDLNWDSYSFGTTSNFVDSVTAILYVGNNINYSTPNRTNYQIMFWGKASNHGSWSEPAFPNIDVDSNTFTFQLGISDEYIPNYTYLPTGTYFRNITLLGIPLKNFEAI